MNHQYVYVPSEKINMEQRFSNDLAKVSGLIISKFFYLSENSFLLSEQDHQQICDLLI